MTGKMYPVRSALFAEPFFLLWQLVDTERGLEAHEMEGPGAAVAAEELSYSAAGRAEVLIWLWSQQAPNSDGFMGGLAGWGYLQYLRYFCLSCEQPDHHLSP